MRHVHMAILAMLAIFVALQCPVSAIAQNKKIILADATLSPTPPTSRKLPKGWALKVWHGKADIRLIQEKNQDAKVLRMRSKKTSISIHRELKLDLKKFPFLSWKWKVTKLPKGADARNGESDDQAAGIYVVFPRFPSFINSQLIGYVWETNAPVGSILKSRKNPMVHYIVIRSGMDDLDKWITEKRNVMDDYRRVFGSEAPKVGGIALMIDTDDTLSDAESYFARVEFNGRPSRVSTDDGYGRLARVIDSTNRAYE